jgi:hypothetical protein
VILDGAEVGVGGIRDERERTRPECTFVNVPDCRRVFGPI